MEYYLVILRFLHISTGVFWAGAAIYLAAFVLPAVKAAGPEGSKFMQQLSRTNGLPIWMMVMSTLNILSGIALVDKLSIHFDGAWMGSPYGMTLSIGGVFAILAYIAGMIINMPTVRRMAALGAEISKAGGPPNAAQVEEMGKLRGKLTMGTNVIAILLALCVIAMGIAQYVPGLMI